MVLKTTRQTNYKLTYLNNSKINFESTRCKYIITYSRASYRAVTAIVYYNNIIMKIQTGTIHLKSMAFFFPSERIGIWIKTSFSNIFKRNLTFKNNFHWNSISFFYGVKYRQFIYPGRVWSVCVNVGNVTPLRDYFSLKVFANRADYSIVIWKHYNS